MKKTFLFFLAITLLIPLAFADDYFDGPRISLKGAPSSGNPNAAVTIIEFSDFQCPMCAVVQDALKKIRSRYPNDVRLVFKHFPLQMHKDARLAHEASLCAEEQGKFWEYREHLFENQTALKKGDLITYANQLGMNQESFTQCLNDERYAAKVEADYQEAVRFGMRGTPTFVINRQVISGAYPYKAFEEIIEEELEIAKK